MSWISYLIIIIVLTAIYIFFRKGRRTQQLAFIKNYHFHKSIRGKISKTYPHLTDEQTHLVFRALRDYFWMCNMGKRQMVAMSTPTLAQEGIKRAWHLACAKEGINPGAPLMLPLIFSIDSILNIPNGFKYSLNCQDKNSPAQGDGYCAGHIGCSSGCAGDSGVETTGSGGFFDGMFNSDGAQIVVVVAVETN